MTATLSTTIRVHSHFARSVHVERDAQTWLNGFTDYIITPLARQVWGRVAEGLRNNSSSRAWTITGPYGSGKSAFALALTQLLGPGDVSVPLLTRLAKEDTTLAAEFAEVRSSGRRFLPVLVSGQRQQLTPALLDGLVRGIKTYEQSFPHLVGLVDEAEQIDKHDARAVTELVERAATQAGGVLLIVDELGKFLEYANQRPDKADIFALQLLAEAAARSGQSPLLLITILHQAFSLYGTYLTRSQREEFAKVQGRFEDISFQQPADQMLRLVQSAMDFSASPEIVQAYREKARELAGEAINLGLVPASVSTDEAVELLVGCAPLHPLTALLLGSVFRKLSQNERSIFAFLSSYEPNGLQDILSRLSTERLEFYTVDRLYDYVSTTCGTWLYQDPVDGRRWAQVDSTLNRLRGVEPLDVQVVKVVGLLAAIGEHGEMRPSEGVLRFALMCSGDELESSIDRLITKSGLVYRAFLGSYRLWAGSDVDIEERLRVGRSNVDAGEPLDQMLTRQLEPRPIMVRRHSYDTGSLRFFHVEYVLPERLASAVDKFHESPPGEADGLVIYVPVNNQAQIGRVASDLAVIPASKLSNVVVIPVVLPRTLSELVLEKQALKWVEQNTPELAADDVARHELRSRLTATEELLAQQVESVLEPSGEDLHVFHDGKELRLPGAKGLNIYLSGICDRLYHAAPAIRNELINRNNISSAAAAARGSLLKKLVHARHQERLGIPGYPPELSMYRSLLEATGIHRPVDGEWTLCRPEPGTSLAPVWEAMEHFLETTTRQKRPLSELWSLLKKPPLGLKNGVIPVLICVLLLERHLDIALFENGTFVTDLTDAHCDRLIKTPDKFEIRYCPLEGVRLDVFQELKNYGIGSKDMRVVGAVRPLVKFVAQLPPYSRNTRTVSREAQDVRRILLTAREPDELLFYQLPQAVGLPGFAPNSSSNLEEAQEFAKRLQGVIRELHLSYERLVERLVGLLTSILAVPSDVAAARHELRQRCQGAISLTADLRMKAFLTRLSDNAHDDRAWIESVAALLVSQPPHTWGDGEIGKFESELMQFSSRFRALEDLALAMGRTARMVTEQASAIRIGLTVAGDRDYHQVVLVNNQQRRQVEQTAQTLLASIQELDRGSQLAAVTEVLKSLLQNPRT